MYGHGLNYGDVTGQVGGHSGLPWLGGLFTLIVVGLVIAATVISIILLINAARNRGVEVKGGRLAAFWFVGICLTPIMLALYVLTLKPAPNYATVPVAVGAIPQNQYTDIDPTEPMPGFEDPTEQLETLQAIDSSEATIK